MEELKEDVEIRISENNSRRISSYSVELVADERGNIIHRTPMINGYLEYFAYETSQSSEAFIKIVPILYRNIIILDRQGGLLENDIFPIRFVPKSIEGENFVNPPSTEKIAIDDQLELIFTGANANQVFRITLVVEGIINANTDSQ